MAGSGVTFHSIIIENRNVCTQQYEDTIRRFPGLKPKDIERFKSGFQDGFNTAVQMLVRAGAVIIEPEPTKEPETKG